MDNKKFIYDYIIIGAGSAGLSLAQLLKNKSNPTLLILESHFYPGGSSSYFQRENFIFDVGATTLSGLEVNRPLDLFQKKTGIQFKTKKIDPGIVFFLKNNFLERASNHDEWIKQFDHFFNLSSTKNFWDNEKKLHDEAWKISTSFPYFPSMNPRFFPSYLNSKTLSSIKLIPHLKKPISDYFDPQMRADSDIIKLFNELIYITAQNTVEHTPHLLASMGLFYPEDTHYPWGGMKGFIDTLCENLPIHFKNEVTQITKSKQIFTIKTKTGEYQAKNIISTLPIWNTYRLLENKNIFAKKYNEEYFKQLKSECWSAFTLYFAVPERKRSSLYYQIHFPNEEISHHQIRSMFVSFSHSEDRSRAPQGFQTVSISIHLKPDATIKLHRSSESYKVYKNQIQKIILNKFLSVFQFREDEISALNAGTPHTFLRYTKREEGLVGGVPHDIKRMPFDLHSSYTNDDHFFLLGDTVFPGQGIAATFSGALNLSNHLK